MSKILYRVIQENSIENFVQDCLPYILKPYSYEPTLNDYVFALRSICITYVV